MPPSAAQPLGPDADPAWGEERAGHCQWLPAPFETRAARRAPLGASARPRCGGLCHAPPATGLSPWSSPHHPSVDSELPEPPTGPPSQNNEHSEVGVDLRGHDEGSAWASIHEREQITLQLEPQLGFYLCDRSRAQTENGRAHGSASPNTESVQASGIVSRYHVTRRYSPVRLTPRPIRRLREEQKACAKAKRLDVHAWIGG
jgi:hypothetical protein